MATLSFTFFHLGSTSASLLTLSLCAFWLWMFLSAVDSRDRHYLAYEWNFGISRFAFQMIVQILQSVINEGLGVRFDI